MNVFLSCGCTASRQLAKFLHSWLPKVLDTIEPHCSEEILTGTLWPQKLKELLEAADAVVIILTKENLHSTWMAYEAGVVAGRAKQQTVCPYLVGVGEHELSTYLTQFNLVKPDSEGMLKLLQMLNLKATRRIPNDALEKALKQHWPELEKVLSELRTGSPLRAAHANITYALSQIKQPKEPIAEHCVVSTLQRIHTLVDRLSSGQARMDGSPQKIYAEDVALLGRLKADEDLLATHLVNPHQSPEIYPSYKKWLAEQGAAANRLRRVCRIYLVEDIAKARKDTRLMASLQKQHNSGIEVRLLDSEHGRNDFIVFGQQCVSVSTFDDSEVMTRTDFIFNSAKVNDFRREFQGYYVLSEPLVPANQFRTVTASPANIVSKAIRKTLARISAPNSDSTPPKWNVPRGTDIRPGAFGKPKGLRLVVHLYSRGCEWVRTAGGCTMCGFHAGTSEGKPSPSGALVKQLSEAINANARTEFVQLDIYNGGNFLNPAEVPVEELHEMAALAKATPQIETLCIESRLEYITEKRITEIKNILGGKELVLGIGIESANDRIRALCINKGGSIAQTKRVLRGVQDLCRIRAYVLLKPPFLTEREAIGDAIATVKFCCAVGIAEIHLESTVVQPRTLVDALHCAGLYRPPWLWSICEVLKGAESDVPLFVSPFKYNVPGMTLPHNCDECNHKVRKWLLEEYNSTFSLDGLKELKCGCRERWEDTSRRLDERSLEERVTIALEALDKGRVSSV